MLHQFSIPAETALRLSEAGLMLDGAVPYVDFFDNVTPFCLYLNLVPVYISNQLFCHPILAANVLTVIMFMISATLLSLLSQISSRRNPLTYAIWPILIVFALTTALQPVHFSQANQLFFMLLCPYIACRACSARALPMPRELATVIGAGLCLTLVMDSYYCLYLFLFELALLLSFFPFPKFAFVIGRYLGVELKVVVYILSILLVGWLLVPSDSTDAYLNIITKINDYSVNIFLMPLSFFDTCTDTRPVIYMACLLLVLALAQARQCILVRLFGIASILGFGLMLIQGATLAFQTYLFLGFSLIAFAASLPRQPLLRRSCLHLANMEKTCQSLLSLNRRWYAPAALASFALVGLCTFEYELSQLGENNRYDLRQLGYHGLADRRDLTILSEVIEQYSKPREPVGILSLGVRPAYPVITQLRRKPALSLTWGFPIDTLNVIEDASYGAAAEPLRIFKKAMYARLARDLLAGFKAPWAPALVLIDEDETRRTLDEQGVTKTLLEGYDLAGMASLKAFDARDGHPPLEYVGYRAALDIYRHKK